MEGKVIERAYTLGVEVLLCCYCVVAVCTLCKHYLFQGARSLDGCSQFCFLALCLLIRLLLDGRSHVHDNA